MKYQQELPPEVEKELDAYVDRIRAIKWFKPNSPARATIDKQINIALKAFGVEASVEYRLLKTPEDWVAARDAARDAAWDAAWGAARGAARDAARVAVWGAAWGAVWGAAWDAARVAARDAARVAARDAARVAARDAARDAARVAARGAAWDAARVAVWDAVWDAAWGAADLLSKHTGDKYTEEYPEGNFIQLIPLWEAGLYPIGVVGGIFVCYVPKGGEALLDERKPE